jgi:hypothetical protein
MPQFDFWSGCSSMEPGLSTGSTFYGPEFVEQLDSTSVIPPGIRVEVNERLNIRICVSEDSK